MYPAAHKDGRTKPHSSPGLITSFPAPNFAPPPPALFAPDTAPVPALGDVLTVDSRLVLDCAGAKAGVESEGEAPDGGWGGVVDAVAIVAVSGI
jgi:hypothetical protein